VASGDISNFFGLTADRIASVAECGILGRELRLAAALLRNPARLARRIGQKYFGERRCGVAAAATRASWDSAE
jgi:hypothetical protein